MMLHRCARLCGRGPLRPYQTVLQAMQLGARGLLVASEVCQQFTEFSRQAAAESVRHPLTAFCGTPSDVVPYTVLTMKALCDLKQMEAMRRLFAQCVNELVSGVAPANVELFNVYLTAISLSDTFNAHEVDNVAALMAALEVHPDAVTRLSVFILHLRLGRTATGGWAALRDEVRSLIAAGAAGRYPLLELRLLHCFQVLLRLHHDVGAIHECFSLVRAVGERRLTPEHLIPYMVLSVANSATPPRVVLEVLRLLERLPQTNGGGLPLHSEVTAFRLLAKCTAYADAAAFDEVLAYLQRANTAGAVVVHPENRPVLTLLQMQVYAAAGRLADVFSAAAELGPGPWLRPGERPKILLKNRRVTLGASDPVTDVLQALASGGAAGIEELAEQLGVGADAPPPPPVTLALLLAAAACIGADELAAALLRRFEAHGLALCGPAVASYIAACLPHRPALAAERTRWALDACTNNRLAQDLALADASMEAALAAGDVPLALRVAAIYAHLGSAMAVKYGVRLARLAASTGDAALIRQSREALEASHTPVDAFRHKLLEL